MEPNRTLRFARQERGWSQAVLAAHLETSAKIVSRWERGTARPSPYFRMKLCQLFGTTAHALGIIDPPAAPVLAQMENAATSHRQNSLFLPIVDPTLPPLSLSSTQVIGRDALLERTITTLCSGHTCALHGLPGVGKTTLAQMLARHETIQERFPDGVLWIGLGPSPDSASAFTYWAKLLGVSEDMLQRASTVKELRIFVQQALETRKVLLIIDDAWTYDDARPFLLGGSTCAHLLTTRFPQVALLATDDPPILVPELDETETSQLLTALVPVLATEDGIPLQHLFRMTGGLPLAVTLLGKYLRLHTYSGQPRRLQAALASLSDTHTRLHLALPVSTMKREGDAPLSLQKIIALSDEHLSAQAQEALRALSVLPCKPERFSEAAALFICQHDASVLDQLSDAGLLESAGPGQYWMHQTIADYGQVCIEAKQPGETGRWRRLVEYALECMAAHARNASVLEREHATLLSALDATKTYLWQQEQLTLTRKLSHYWALHGYATLARERFVQALTLAKESNDTLGAGWMLYCLGALAETYGVLLQAQQYFEEALALLSPFTDANIPLLKALLISLGIVVSKQGHLAEAEAFYQQALALIRVQEGPFDVCTVLINLGVLVARRGQLTSAKHTLQEGLEVLQGRDMAMQGAFLCSLGEVCSLLRDGQEEAWRMYQQALELSEREHLPMVCCEACLGLGVLAQRQNQREEAHTWFQKVLVLAKEHEFHEQYISVLISLATLALDEHAYDRAEQVLAEAMTRAQTGEHVLFLCRCHVARGNLFLHLHQVTDAQSSFETALHLVSSEYVLQQIDIQEGLIRVAAAQGEWQKVSDLGTVLLEQFVNMEYWKVDSFKYWLTVAQEEQTQEGLAQEEQAQRENEERNEMPLCPRCQDRSAVRKRGKSRAGVQRYHCSHCQQDFTPSSSRTRAPSDRLEEQAHILVRQGMSQRAIARALGVHHETVRRWLMLPIQPRQKNKGRNAW